jgi:hypothetical protein
VNNFYSGNAVAYCGLFPAGTTFHILVRVLSGNKIDFLVANESEWKKVERGFHYDHGL